MSVECVDIRSFATSKHHQVDDRTYGGGPGMVLMAEPLAAALRDVAGRAKPGLKRRVLYVSPQGPLLTAESARRLATYDELVIVCGAYEGIDERIVETFVDEEVSIGDYVLTSGCLPALVILDATVRFIPGVVGKEASTQEDSFEQGLFDHPHYTRPEVWEEKSVPPVLLTGDHAAIKRWRHTQALDKTARVRPDLFLRYQMREGKAGEDEEAKAAKACIEEILLPVVSLKKTERFYKECFRWKPLVKTEERLVYVLEGMQRLVFIESALSEKGRQKATFTLSSHALRACAKQIATAHGFSMRGEDKIEMIWWEDPDGYRWLFAPLECKT